MSGDEPQLHGGVAEYGKVCALRGDHVGALLHYRAAMSMAIVQQTPPVVIRHYMECALESLEQMGAYDEVLAYCDRAIEHYADHPPDSALAQFDLSTFHQRRGVVLLRRGARDEAAGAFDVACAIAHQAEAELPLAETLLRWIRSRLTITAERLSAEQARWRYCAVRQETVRPARAVPLPGHGGTMSSPVGNQRRET